MNDTATTTAPAKATFKAHGKPSAGIYFGAAAEAASEGEQVTITSSRSGVLITDRKGYKVASFGTATKFWLLPQDEQAPEAAEEMSAEAPQPEPQPEAPKAERVAKKAATAGPRTIPAQAANKKRQAYVEEVGMAKYRNQYNAGWDAATAGQGAKKAASGEAPVAWMDGYTDRVANPGKEGIANKWAALRATTAPVKKVEAPKEG